MAVLHVEMVDGVFGVSGGIYGTELSVECTDERGVVVYPVW